jgi:hypothetical protein
MKKKVLTNLSVALFLAFTAVGCADSNQANNSASQDAAAAAAFKTTAALPQLHQIEEYTFQAPYSCNNGDLNYEKSALFLSQYSKSRNSPDLLFNGSPSSDYSCSKFYVSSVTAGDDFALISDLGNVSLESVNASKAFNYSRIVGQDNIFKQDMLVVVGHTYTVLVAKSEIRALYAFTVESISLSGEMKIKYAVKSYAIQTTKTESIGFDWEKENN